MNTFTISTLGCKVNQYESQQVRELLERFGLKMCIPPEQPDLVIINTCCITHIASAKSRKYIHKTQTLYPDTTIVVCGCLPVVQNEEHNQPTRNIFFIKNRSVLATFLKQTVFSSYKARIFPGNQNIFIKTENHTEIKYKNQLPEYPQMLPLTSFNGQTRAFLKVQDGCDANCSYCIIPKTRPCVQSNCPDDVIKEAQALVKSGHKEIVLTGITIGAYGQSSARRSKWQNRNNEKLADLLDNLAQIPGLARIRLSSLEPLDVTERLVDVFCRGSNIMPHLHLSIQSGSDAILGRMCRQYNSQQVKDVVDLLKSRLDRPAITTDIIVGFPGESDEDFQQTVDLARYIGFAKMHIFRFSARKGTAAAKMQNKIDADVVKNRARILQELEAELGLAYRRQFIGENVQVLIENAGRQAQGRCERYFLVNLNNSDKKIKNNVLITARVVDVTPTGAIGEVV